MRRFDRATLLLACLAVAAVAGENAAPISGTLDEVTVSNDRERQRLASPSTTVNNPDIITLSRKGKTSIRMQFRDSRREIGFRRESAARMLTGNPDGTIRLTPDVLTAIGRNNVISDITLELAANIDEADGSPALIQFGPHLSLVDFNHVRMRDFGRPTIFYVNNVVDPETRRCDGRLGFGDDGLEPPRRFILVADSLADCFRALQGRTGDVIFSSEFPEKLRQPLLDIYEPLISNISFKLGSEPGLMFVALRPESTRGDFNFERGWIRSSLLLFNGTAWQQGFSSEQSNKLREAMTLEQIQRRVLPAGQADAFALSAVSYLFLLATAGHENATRRKLADSLPVWINSCAQDLNAETTTAPPRKGISSPSCSLVLHFVYDAVARAQSKGEDSVHATWRQLLAASYRRRETGVSPAAFITSSKDAQDLTLGLMNGSMDWPGFAADLARFGVQLRVTGNDRDLTTQVLSLPYFNDEPN